MEEKKNLLTYAGLKKLEDELHDLKVVKRKEVAGKIKEAREQGDLSENAEYDAAKDEQRDIEARIEEIEKILKNAEVVVVCAQIEAEIAELDTEEEKKEFLETLGLEQSGLDKLIKSSYALLGLISYLTAGPQEVRAWTIKVGTKAPAAGGKIHSDIERGFIRAETIAFNDLVQVGTMTAAKEKGLVRLEGKEYVVKDGDVILFRFNV